LTALLSLNFSDQIEKKTIEYTKLNAEQFLKLAQIRLENYKQERERKKIRVEGINDQSRSVVPQSVNAQPPPVIPPVVPPVIEQPPSEPVHSPNFFMKLLSSLPTLSILFLFMFTLFITLPTLYNLNSRVQVLEKQLETYSSIKTNFDELQDRLGFLEYFVSYLSHNITNNTSIVQEQHKYWKANQQLSHRLEQVKQTIDTLQQILKSSSSLSDSDEIQKNKQKILDKKSEIFEHIDTSFNKILSSTELKKEESNPHGHQLRQHPQSQSRERTPTHSQSQQQKQPEQLPPTSPTKTSEIKQEKEQISPPSTPKSTTTVTTTSTRSTLFNFLYIVILTVVFLVLSTLYLKLSKT
jgi:hypothetical protein